MKRALSFHRTTIGKKAIMAVSGIIVFGFVVVHMVANLQMYVGAVPVNEYGASLRRLGPLLWVARGVILLATVAHIASAFQLASRNGDARPKGYRYRKDLATNYAARTMVWSGPILLLYLVYHLAHLTYGQTPGYDYEPSNVYNNAVLGFRVWWISAIYIIGNIALGMHLFHGAWSLFQSLGISHPRYDHWRRSFATLFAVIVTVGNLSMPISVMAGAIQPTPPGAFCYPELEPDPSRCDLIGAGSSWDHPPEVESGFHLDNDPEPGRDADGEGSTDTGSH